MNWDYLICFTLGLLIGATLLGALLWCGVKESGARCNGCDSDDQRPRSADSPNRECNSPDQSQSHELSERKAQNNQAHRQEASNE